MTLSRKLRLVAASAFVGGAVFGVSLATASAVSKAVSETPEPISFEPRELPREWVWQRGPITFDHMFCAERDVPRHRDRANP